MTNKILVIGAAAGSLINFRGELLKLLVSKGFKVTALASESDVFDTEILKDYGVEYRGYPVSRSSLNPKHDLKTFFVLVKKFNEIQPNYILAYTIKPIIWGGLASKFLKKTTFVAMITGIGYALQPGGFLKNILVSIVRFLYKIALSHSKAVIFQNKDNLDLFVKNKIIDENRCFLVNGSGVNLKHYTKKGLPNKPVFLLIARLLKDKGIIEYIKAANIVKSKYPNAVFNLVGPEDPSPDSLKFSDLTDLNNGAVNYYGGTNDVRPWLESCSVFVLPSYHEGMPRTVLEAMATGRPILTTNVPGCKETVINGVNGWLVNKASTDELAERMCWFIDNQESWVKMADKSFELVNKNFDVHSVNKDILRILGI